MNIVWGSENPQANQAMGNWCAAHLGFRRPFDAPFTTMGVFEGSDLVSVVLYNNFHPDEGVVELHCASTTPRWLAKPVLWAMFDFPFNKLGCQTVVMRVSENNTRLLRILTAYGFDHVLIPRLRGRNEGERVFWLTDDAWKANHFHKENGHGQIAA